VHVGPISVFAGVAANVFVTDGEEQGDRFHPALDETWVDGDVTTRLWPSVHAGIRISN
jgi:hypothetical protein